MSQVENSCPHIITEQQGKVLTVRINRAERKNALTHEMYTALTDAIDILNNTPSLRVLLISGSNECFTSGNDMVDFIENPPIENDSPVYKFMTGIATTEKPIVAAVNGPAIGIGTTMLLHCDLVYSSEEALFSMPFTTLGLCPEAGSSLIIPQLAGHVKAAELLLLGEKFSPQTAKELGIINDICANDEVFNLALSKAKRLAELPPKAVRLTKSLIKENTKEAVRTTIANEARFFGEQLQAAEAKEAMQAFMQKRAPDFSQFD